MNGRCGPGTRIPFIVVSPYARTNHVSSTYISQASVVRFIEDNWLRGQRIGGGSFDASSGSIMDLFDFDQDHSHDYRTDALFLDPTSGTAITSPPDEHHHH
ncbi:hypothetical protein ACVW0J_003396 [Bradyrhizobium sp. i1.7.7]